MSKGEYDADRISDEDIGDISASILTAFDNELEDLIGAEQFERVAQLSPSYINYAINRIFLYINSFEDSTPPAGLERLEILLNKLQKFLHRSGAPYVVDTHVSEEAGDIAEIEEMFFGQALTKEGIENLQGMYFPKSRGEAALQAAAEFFGYRGPATYDAFKDFFTVERASMYGFYWSGEGWYTNDEDDFDEFQGGDSRDTMVKLMLEMKDHPWDALGSRYDFMMVDWGVNAVKWAKGERGSKEKRVAEVRRIAGLMEKAFYAEAK